jgi:F0F1-type ATP synthase membrane subunit b/b'
MNKPTKIITTILALILVLAVAPAAQAALTVNTDTDKYQYGEWINVSGTGAAPNLPVTIQVLNPTGTLVAQRTTTADNQGTFTLANVMKFPTPPLPAHLPLGNYTVKAIDGQGNTAQKTIQFTVLDTTPPTITHTPVTTANINTAVTITATVTDNVAVQTVTLYYRTVGTATFTSVAMTPGVGNVYSAIIPATAVTTAGVEYYITATDTSNNQARAPTTGTYTITVLVATLTITPDHAAPGASASYSGTNFTPNTSYSLTIDWSGITVTLAAGTVTPTGTISGTFKVPAVQSQVYTIVAKDRAGITASAKFGVEQVSTTELATKIDALSTQLTNVENTLSKKMDTIQETLSKAVNDAKIEITGAISRAESNIKGAITDAQTALAANIKGVDDSVKAAQSALAGSVKSVEDSVKAAQSDIKAAVSSAQTDVKSAVSSAQTTLSGSISGVKSSVDKLTDTVNNINTGIATTSTFTLVVTALVVITLVIEIVILIRRR